MQKHPQAQLAKVKWYAASAIYVSTPLNRENRSGVFVEERIYLVAACEDDEALKQAEVIARAEENKGQLELDGVPAMETFVGIRKVILVRSHLKLTSEETAHPSNGSELTFAFFRLKDDKSLEAFLRGDAVSMIYEADS